MDAGGKISSLYIKIKNAGAPISSNKESKKKKFFLTGNTALMLKLNTITITKLSLPSSAPNQTFTRRHETPWQQ